MAKSEIPDEYTAGKTFFLGCEIDLSLRPLIPRPETEFWARHAIADLARKKNKNFRILDIFSGSGCVGIAVAKNLPQVKVDFSDIDSLAIEQIRINCKINNIDPNRARIFRSDLFENLPAEKYDAILANPPYVDPARMQEVQPSVLDWEPHCALFAQKGGMALIEKFLSQAKNYLTENGFIYMEFDTLQKSRIDVRIKQNKYLSAEFFKDQFGEWRFVRITK